MKTFEQFLVDSAQASGGGVNILFESGMYSLLNDVENIVTALQSAGVDFEIVGGVAVNAHIAEIERSRSFVTRDIDILVHRSDLDRIAIAAQPLGYQAKKMMGGYTLIRPQQDLGEAIQLLFVGEKSKSTQLALHPDLHPVQKHLSGMTIPVSPLEDLLRMKLSSFRNKDIVHLEILDEVGLITSAVERDLSSAFLDRLKEARERIARDKPDVI